jgi:DNA-binding NarL/FixJ family response regulator
MKTESIVIGTSAIAAPIAGHFRKCLEAVYSGEIRLAFSERELTEAVRESEPYLVFVDAHSWNTATHYVVELLSHQFPAMRIAIFSFEDMTLKSAARFIHCGARGMVNFRFDCNAFTLALRTLVNGGDYIPDEVGAAYEEYRKMPRELTPELSKRETEVYDIMIMGADAGEIAERLYCSIFTVRNHIQKIYKKLCVSKKPELIRFAIDRGDIRIKN